VLTRNVNNIKSEPSCKHEGSSNISYCDNIKSEPPCKHEGSSNISYCDTISEDITELWVVLSYDVDSLYNSEIVGIFHEKEDALLAAFNSLKSELGPNVKLTYNNSYHITNDWIRSGVNVELKINIEGKRKNISVHNIKKRTSV
jgi:hypothetical protein